MSNFCVEYCKEVCNYLDCTTCPTWTEEVCPEEYNELIQLGIDVSNNTPKE